MALDPFAQLLGNPNPLQALLQAPQMMGASAADEDTPGYTRVPSLPALEQGAGAGGPLAMLTAALSGGGPSGPEPMDEVPRGTSGLTAHEEDADLTPREEVAGVDTRAANAGAFPGLGPDLQANLGLGDQPSAFDEDAAPGGGGAPSGAGGGSVYANRPVAPVLDERSLYPSTKRAVLQGVVPGIVALIAGLTGGKAAAAGLLQGAYRGNEDYNSELKERGLLRYREAQQKFARDDRLWQDEKAKAERKATVLSALAEKARSFANPADGKAWLQAQIPLYAALDINPMEAWGMAEVGADERRRVAAQKVVDDALARQAELAKMSGQTVDPAKLPDQLMVTWDGKRQLLRDVMAVAQSSPLEVPANATVTEKTRAVNADIATSIVSFTARTGRQPTVAERSAIERDAWSKYENDEAMKEQFAKVKLRNEILTGQHLAAMTNKANREPSSVTPQQDMFARNRMQELNRNKAYVQFVVQGQAYDNFIGTYEEAQKENSGLSDIALISEYVRAKHPGSNRVGDQEQAMVELARDGLSSIAQVVPRVFTSGAKLTAKQRQQMYNVLTGNYDASARGVQSIVNDYADMLRRRGIDPADYMQTHHGSINRPVLPNWAQQAVDQQQAEADAAEKNKPLVINPRPDTSVTLGAPTPAQARDKRLIQPPPPTAQQGGRRFIPGAMEAQGDAAAAAKTANAPPPGVTPSDFDGMIITDPASGKRGKVVGRGPDGKLVLQEQ